MQDIVSAVRKCLTHRTENGQVDLDTGQAFTNVVLKFAEVRQVYAPWKKYTTST